MCSIVVTDFSYALINSLLKSFNNCQLSHYIMWTYHVLIQFPDKSNQIGNMMKIKIYICSVHFLKSLIQKVKKLEKNPIVAKSFIFAFSLLQKTVTIKQFDVNLWQSANHSLEYLKTEVSNRKYSHLNISNVTNFVLFFYLPEDKVKLSGIFLNCLKFK